MVAVKICGITNVSDAEACVDAGADAIGLNFHPKSPRRCDDASARDIVKAVGQRTLVVGVFVNASYEQLVARRDDIGLGCVQLHGDEPPELLERLLPHAYKAIRVRDAASIDEARKYGGKHILLDAWAPDAHGGTGRTFQWSLARALANERHVTLAGGLNPDNVTEAIGEVGPFCVDVASGVEASPGRKDLARVRAFIDAARAASAPSQQASA
jgi:phosphoribosylanthranilate isomerase